MVTTGWGDAHHLTFAEATFQLVLALGVLQWLHTPDQAIRELGRVVKPGGYVLVTAHNRWRLVDLLDPWLCPPLDPIKGAAGAALRWLGLRRAPPHLEPVAQVVSAAELGRWLRTAGLKAVKSVTLGFGPFTFFGHGLFTDATGVKLHGRLQRCADRNVPLVRSVGAQHLILAQKPSLDCAVAA
jgi:ubiquinone/menaquinone biosynthesis C-methylase UbiE